MSTFVPNLAFWNYFLYSIFRASIVLLYMCIKNPRKIKTGQYNLYDILLNAYAFGPFIFYIGGVICNAYFFFIPNHSDKFQHCFEELGVSINITGNIESYFWNLRAFLTPKRKRLECFILEYNWWQFYGDNEYNYH